MATIPLENLRRLLSDLHDYLTGAAGAAFVDTKALATDIRSIVLAELRPEDTALSLSLIFNPERGVLQFLRLTRGSKEHDDAKVILCDLLAEYSTKVTSSISEYAVDIKSTCVVLFGGKESSKVKQASFLPLLALLDPNLQISDPERLEIGKLFKIYFDTYIQQLSKLTASVKACILDLLGMIARFYPKHVDARQRSQLQRFYIQNLETLFNVRGKEIDLTLVAGTMKGLNHFMFTFSPGDKAVGKDLALIFKCIKHVIQPTGDLTRYEVPKAGLQMIIDHAPQFGSLLFGDYRAIYDNLKEMSAHKNRDLQKMGFTSIDAFLRQIANVLVSKSGGAPERECFWFFMKQFSDTLRSEESSVREISLAIRGYGIFAAPCRKYVEPQELHEVLAILLKKNAFLFSDANEQQEETAGHIASFIQAFAYIAKELDVIEDSFLAAIAFQALVLTCTDAPGREANVVGDAEAGMPEPAYKDYMYFWDSLFDESNFVFSASPEEVEPFLVTIYDQIISAILRLPPNLNLTTIEVDEDTAKTVIDIPSSGDVAKLRAENPKDFAIFVNFVDFCQAFLPRVRQKDFVRWIHIVGEEWVRQSSKYPLVSGFYKLVGLCLHICQSVGYFDEVIKPGLGASREGLEEELRDTATGPQKSSYVLFTKYIREIAIRMHQYKDDLLASCLRLVLSSPRELISVADIVQPMQIALKLGLSYPPLAVIALDALEGWTADGVGKEVEEACEKILPGLADYLMLDSDAGLELVQSAGGKKAKSGVKTAPKPFSIAGLAKGNRNAGLISEGSTTSAQLRDIRLRIVRLLGSLGGVNHLVVGAPEGADLIAWDMENRIRFDVPFKELNVSIYLDDILPRVMEVAENSADRKAKVAASELLHATVLLMIGRSAQSLVEKESQFQKLFLKVFPALLRLAVDVEKVTRDLFRPLVFQLIHWFTKNTRAENPESMIMLNASLDAVTSPNGPLRDFGAECAAEFLKYSIKHTSAKVMRDSCHLSNVHRADINIQGMEENPMNAKSLFKRIYQLCQHTNHNKRLGAALTFNRIYRIFREEQSLVDQFAFEILYNLLFSLKLADNDDPALGTQRQTIDAIMHVSKIIQKRASLFQRAKPSRRGFDGLERADLPSLLEWLFREMRRHELVYTHQCMELFMELVTEISAPKVWLAQQTASSPNFVVETFEGAKLEVPRGEPLPSARAQAWMRQYTAALEGYSFLTDAQVLDPEQIWTNPASTFADAWKFFIDNYANERIQASSAVVLTPGEIMRLNGKKSNVIVKTLLFVQILLSRSGADRARALDRVGFWTESFFRLVANCVFKPMDVGFDMESEEVKKHLPERTSVLLKLLHKHLPSRHKTSLIESLATKYWDGNLDINQSSLTDTAETSSYLRVISGLSQLQTVGILEDVIGEREDGGRYLGKVFDQIPKINASTDPTLVGLVGHLLALFMRDERLLPRCFTELLAIGQSDRYAEGAAFYRKHSDPINTHLALNFGAFAQFALRHVDEQIVRDILHGLLDFLLANKRARVDECLSFMKDLVEQVEFLQRLVRKSQTGEGRDFLVTLWKKILLLDRRVLKNSRSPEFNRVFADTYLWLIAPSVSLASKNEALDMLPVLLSEDTYVQQLEKLLCDMVVNQFPMSVDDLVEGTSQYNDYITAMDKLLKAVGTSENAVRPILKALVGHVCRESEHKYADPLRRALEMAAGNLSKPKFMELSDTCFEYFRNEMFAMDVRRNVISQMLSPALIAGSADYVREVFIREVKFIMGRLEEPLTGKLKDLKDHLLEKAACYDLMQICYSRLPVSDVHTPAGKVVLGKVLLAFKASAQTGKELSQSVMKLANAAKNERVPPEEPKEFAPFRLQYHQSAYNALAAVIMSTQKENYAKFATTFLFKETPAKEEHQWRNLIDLSVDVCSLPEFQGELDKPLLKTRLEQYRTRSALDQPVARQKQSIRYLSSQYLADSSLSQSVGVFGVNPTDFNVNGEAASVRVGNGETGAPKSLPSQSLPESEVDDPMDIDPTGEQASSSFSEDILELDFFNRNPCMKAIVAIIEKLHTSPNVDAGERADRMPSWMQEIHKKFTESDLHINIRLFLAKIIINLPTVFLPHASFWWEPLAQLIADADMYSPNGINYFVQDLAVQLLVWIEPVPEDGENKREALRPAGTYENKKLIFSMIKTLSGKASHTSKAAINNNLKIIRQFVENWRELVVSPTDVIYDFIASKAEERNRILTGIFLVSIMVANSIPAFNESGAGSRLISELQFNNALVESLGNRYKEVYGPCAEALGQVLHYYDKTNVSMCHEVETLVHTKLNSMNSTQGKGPEQERFILIINRISLSFPQIVKERGKELLFLLPRLFGSTKARCLEALSSWADKIPQLFEELVGKNLMGMIRQRDDECQTYLLVILFTLAPTITQPQISMFLEVAIQTFIGHSSNRCRRAFYTLILRLHSKIYQMPPTERDAQIEKLLRLAMMKGLADRDEEVRRGLIDYIHRETDFAKADVFRKLEEAISTFYVPDVEDSFLNYTTYLMLEATKEAPTYNANLFANGLPDAHFADSAMDIDVSWVHNKSMQPLFASTQQEDQRSEMAATTTAPSSQLIVTGAVDRSRLARPSAYALKRRTYRYNPRDERVYFARRAERMKRDELRALKFESEAQARKVVLARTYRAGELPDILIKHKEILDPLRALAQRDTDISRLLFSSLMVAIYRGADEIETEDGADEYAKRIKSHIKKMLQDSTILFSPFIGSIFRVLHELPELGCAAPIIFRASVGSSNYELGVLLLEKLIREPVPQPPAPKKQRSTHHSSNNRNVELWAQMAKLYKAMDNMEVYQSIFEDKVTSRRETKDAVNAEILGDYEHALEFYKQALESDAINVEASEMELWSHGQMECLNKLGEWDLLAFSVMHEVDNRTEDLWDEKHVDPDLAFFIRSFLRLREGVHDEDGIFSAWSEENPNPLFLFLENALSDPSKRALLEANFSHDLAVSFILQRDFNLARHYVSLSQQQFLRNFANLHPLAKDSRTKLVGRLQEITEMNEFLQLPQSNKKVEQSKTLNQLIAKWDKRYPSTTIDSIDVWDDVTTNRQLMLDNLDNLLVHAGSNNGTAAISSPVLDARQSDYCRMISKAARHQKNFALSEKWLTRSNTTPNTFDPAFHYAGFKLNLSKFETTSSDESKADICARSIATFEWHRSSIRELDPVAQAKFRILEGQLHDASADVLARRPKEFSERLLGDKYVRKAVSAAGHSRPSNESDLLKFFTERGFESLQEAIHLLEKQRDKMQDKARLKLASHCDRVLRLIESSDNSALTRFIDPSSYAASVTENVLTAMQNGSTAAIELFPRLLQLIASEASIRSLFEEKASPVSSWMFLRWLPQMTALLDKATAQAVLSILRRIAEDYPNALFAPLSISSEQYVFGSDIAAQKSKKEVERLKNKTTSRRLVDMIRELKRLTNPDHIFKEWHDRTEALISSNAPNKATEIANAFEELSEYCLKKSGTGSIDILAFCARCFPFRVPWIMFYAFVLNQFFTKGIRR
ncbi:hypothetical protein HK104_007244 [Borealophlyctis nickersoniae]|nr:hypothetical protein HK104_007244 [Borealophlyctis nickersoniae]